MAGGRKGYGEELRIRETLAEITPLMFKHLKEVMASGDDKRKDKMVEKILPKIIDKALPTEFTGEHGGAIVIQIAEQVAQKYGFNESSSTDSQ